MQSSNRRLRFKPKRSVQQKTAASAQPYVTIMQHGWLIYSSAPDISCTEYAGLRMTKHLDCGGMSVDVVANVLLPRNKETSAGLLTPPYDSQILFWKPTEDIEPERVRWRDNRILDAKTWEASKAAILAERPVGPRAPWRKRLGLQRFKVMWRTRSIMSRKKNGLVFGAATAKFPDQPEGGNCNARGQAGA